MFISGQEAGLAWASICYCIAFITCSTQQYMGRNTCFWACMLCWICVPVAILCHIICDAIGYEMGSLATYEIMVRGTLE